MTSEELDAVVDTELKVVVGEKRTVGVASLKPGETVSVDDIRPGGMKVTVTAATAFESRTPDGKPRMSDGFERIVKAILDLPDPMAEYDRLMSTIQIDGNLNDLGTLQKAVNEAEGNAIAASKLHANALVEKKACELEWEAFMGPIWVKVEGDLEDQHAKKERKKNITDADVRAECAARYPDEFRDNARRKAHLEALELQMKNLSELWKQRCASLMTLIANRRK